VAVDHCLGWGRASYLPTFGDREGVEAFLESPNMDVPGVAREVPFSAFADLLDFCAQYRRAEFVLVDPSPPHFWGSGDERGEVLRISELVEVLREDFEEAP
jgi:hypothetical protein